MINIRCFLLIWVVVVAAIAMGTATASPAFAAVAAGPATPAAPDSTDPDRIPIPRHWVRVDLSEQTLTAYEGRAAVKTFIVSTGDADHPTLKGKYRVKAKWEKIDVIGQDYYFHDVPYFIKYSGPYAIHAATWHDDFGAPVSHGCVNMRVEDARWVFEFLSVGDIVEIRQ
jgi:lipoprotein-anchoring transpeptidase ErfK/SrfK